MKKKIEKGITFGLIGLSLLIISVLIAGVFDLRLKDTSNMSMYAVIGFVLASVCSYKFPKWNTVTMLRPSTIPEKKKKGELINEYIRDSGSMFLYIAIGYSGLLFCIFTPNTGFDAKWIVGSLLIFCYFQGLITPFLGEKV